MPETVRPGSKAWQLAAGILAATTVAAAVFAGLEYSTVGTLRAQLAAADDDARQATAEETQLRGQLSEAQDRQNAQGQRLAAAVQQASSEAQQLDVAAEQQRLQKSQAHPGAALQELPVRLTFHKAMLGPGQVAVLQNLSNDDLEVTLEVRNPADSDHVRKRVLIGARGMARVGAAQGWRFTRGQVVTLNNARYRPLVQTVS